MSLPTSFFPVKTATKRVAGIAVGVQSVTPGRDGISVTHMPGLAGEVYVLFIIADKGRAVREKKEGNRRCKDSESLERVSMTLAHQLLRSCRRGR